MTAIADQTDPRSAIAAALAAYLTPDQTQKLVDEVLAITKRVPVSLNCDNCGHTRKGLVEVPDAKAVVGALTDLLSQGFGRIGEKKFEDTAIVFKRLVSMNDLEEVPSDGSKPARKRRAPRKAVGKSSRERRGEERAPDDDGLRLPGESPVR